MIPEPHRESNPSDRETYAPLPGLHVRDRPDEMAEGVLAVPLLQSIGFKPGEYKREEEPASV
jgi:hypothetical protein